MSRDTSFYYSFLVLPPHKRRAIVAVWDFCRAVDDAVDEAASKSDAEAELALWRRELAGAYGDGPGPATAQGKRLQQLLGDFNLPRREFELLIDGVEMDLGRVCYPTFEALTEYCRRVAGTVGLICLEIFGYRDDRARTYALDLATALQLTNIIRDVGFDLRQGRIYVPMEDLTRFQVTEAEFREDRLTPRIRALLQFECERTRSYYRRAAAALPAGDRRRLVAAEIMGGIYFEILRRIERAGYDVFTTRIRVARPHRLLIALRIWAASWAPLPIPGALRRL